MSDVAFVLGVALLVVGQLWLVVRAFQHGLGWGLACLFVPFAALAFIVLHWDEAANPFFTSLAGLGCVLYSAWASVS